MGTPSTDMKPITAVLTIEITSGHAIARLSLDDRYPPSEIKLNAISGPWASLAEALLCVFEAETKLVRTVAKNSGMEIRPVAYVKEGQA